MNIHICFLKTYCTLFFHEENTGNKTYIITCNSVSIWYQETALLKTCIIIFSRYDYTLAREYNWNVKNKLSRGYEETYFFVFREDGMFYNELETRSVDAFSGHVLYILHWPTKLKGIKESLCSTVCLSLCLSDFHVWYLKETSAHTLNKSCL